MFNHFIKAEINSYLSLLLYGVVYSIIILGLYFIVNLIINPNLLGIVKNLIKKKRKT